MPKLMILCTTPDERLEMVIHEAQKLDYQLIFCGEKAYEPLEGMVDAFYIVDWDDTKRLVEIGKEEKIDGIVGLCDPAMIAVCKVAAELDLPGNDVASIESLLSKSGFRKLQQQAGVFCPRNIYLKNWEEYSETKLNFPVVIKPVLASSSHGMTVLDNKDGLEAALQEASEVSRNGAVCIEEYIKNDSMRIIEADVFVVDDDIIWDGVRFCYRLENAPLRPVYDVYPVSMTDSQRAEFQDAVRAVLKTAGARLGEYNVEGFFTEEGRFFIVEINPRQAGHYNPQDIEDYCGLNLTKLLITTAVGDRSYYTAQKELVRSRHHVLSYSVFAMEDGVLDHIHINQDLKPKLKVMRYLHGQKEGDPIQNIVDAIRPIAKTVFEFDTAEELEEVRKRITDRVYAVLR